MPSRKHFQQEKIKRLDLQALLDTSRLLIESHDTDFILNNLMLISMGKMMVTRAAILWYQPQKNNYSVLKKKGLASMPPELCPDEALSKGPTVLFCDDNHNIAFLKKFGIELLITINGSDRHLGFLALGPKPNRQPVNSKEIEILQSLAYMSGIAITNSGLVGELRDANRKLDYKIQELTTLFEFGKGLNASLERKEIRRLLTYTLLGQFLISRYFFILKLKDKPVCVAENGLTEELTTRQMNGLFSLKKEVISVDDDLLNQFPFLADLRIQLLLRLSPEEGEQALLGVGSRANREPFGKADYHLLNSLGGLALMSFKNSFLLESQLEKERMEEELSIARSIQQRLFPDNPPKIPGLQIAAKNVPSRQVGGDYYDLIPDEEKNLTLAIADVTGKGVPASLLMANLQSVLHILHPFKINMREATGQINALMYQNTPSDKFISFFWAYYKNKPRILNYVNAGHNPPILLRKDGTTLRLSQGGVLLGAMPTLVPYEETELSLEQEDLLVFYTDGITEAMDEKEEEFDEERLLESVKKRRMEHPEVILDGVIEDVRTFCHNRIGDDLTLIICKVT